jgi:hypothetical protein
MKDKEKLQFIDLTEIENEGISIYRFIDLLNKIRQKTQEIKQLTLKDVCVTFNVLVVSPQSDYGSFEDLRFDCVNNDFPYKLLIKYTDDDIRSASVDNITELAKAMCYHLDRETSSEPDTISLLHVEIVIGDGEETN